MIRLGGVTVKPTTAINIIDAFKINRLLAYVYQNYSRVGQIAGPLIAQFYHFLWFITGNPNKKCHIIMFNIHLRGAWLVFGVILIRGAVQTFFWVNLGFCPNRLDPPPSLGQNPKFTQKKVWTAPLMPREQFKAMRQGK